jgi:hypothetical protein
MSQTKVLLLLNRPIEEDTTIQMEHIVDLPILGTKALMELWSWDGIQGSSVIFLEKDVEHLSDEELIAKASEDLSALKEGEYTIKRVKDYVYINFNFKN